MVRTLCPSRSAIKTEQTLSLRGACFPDTGSSLNAGERGGRRALSPGPAYRHVRSCTVSTAASTRDRRAEHSRGGVTVTPECWAWCMARRKNSASSLNYTRLLAAQSNLRPLDWHHGHLLGALRSANSQTDQIRTCM